MTTQAYRPLLAEDLLGDSWVYLNDSLDALRRHHEGPSSPASPVPYMIWFDTATGLAKERNSANDAWITIGRIGTQDRGLLSRDGGTMSSSSAHINMSGALVRGLGSPSDPLDAARKQELDLKAPLASPTFTGQVTAADAPSADTSLVNRSYTEGRYARLAGGTLTGLFVFPAYGTADYHAVVLKQLREFTTFHTTLGHRHDGSDARKVRATDLDAAGSTGSTQLLRSQGPSSPPVWSVGGKPLMFDGDLTLLVNANSTGSFTTVDLSPYIPGEAVSAVLLLEFQAQITDSTGMSYMSLQLRKTGSAPTSANKYFFNPGLVTVPTWSASPTLRQQAIVELDGSRRFDYKATREASGAAGAYVKAWLAGYLARP